MCGCCGGDSSEESKAKHVMKPRGCTDILCLVIFITFWAVMIFVAAFAFVVGNPRRIVNGFDSFGNVCAVDNKDSYDSSNSNETLSLSGLDMSDKPYVFFFDLHNLKKCWKTCVKVCPDRNLENMADLRDFETRTGSQLCRYDQYFPEHAADKRTSQFACPNFTIFESQPVLNRCVPVKVKGLVENVLYNVYAYLNSLDLLQQVAGDLFASWKEIIGLSFFALVVAFIMVLLIHYVASFVAWIIMIVVVVAAVAVTGVLWWTYVDMKYELDTTPFETILQESVSNKKTFLAFAIISTIITLVLLLVVIVMRKRVKFVAALFREASECIKAMPCLLLQPLWTFLALFVFFIYWMIVMIALATAEYGKHKSVFLSPGSSDHFRGNNATQAQRFSVVDYSDPDPSWVRYMWWFHLIGLVWTSEFILACQQMTIAGAVSYWYFSKNRKEVKCPIASSIYKLTIYHLGSVALGSFIITLIKIPRLVLTYLQATLKKYDENSCAKCCLRCCNCCLWCFEKCIRYLNHNAYTVVAIDGMGFCPAARVAFNALISNALRVAAINSVGDFILFLGKCAIAAITGFVGLLAMKGDPSLHFYAVPIFVVVLFAFFIGHCVLSVYEMVIDTLFLCFCEDYDKNDGTPGKEYYAPPSLLKFLTNRNIEQTEPLQKESYITDPATESHEMKRFSGETERTLV